MPGLDRGLTWGRNMIRSFKIFQTLEIDAWMTEMRSYGFRALKTLGEAVL